MRRWLVRELTRLLAWMDPDVVTIRVPNDAVLARARVFALIQEGFAGRSGEAKRHQVLAQLHKDYPALPWRTLAAVIEAALR